MAGDQNSAQHVAAYLFPASTDSTAVLSEGSATRTLLRTLLMDLLSLSDLLNFRSCCRYAKDLVIECTLRVHRVAVCRKPESVSALLSAFPNAHTASISPSEGWKLADYIAAAQFQSVAVDCRKNHVTDSILARFKGKLRRLLLSESSVSDAGLRHATGTPQVLLYYPTRITPAGISQLVGLRKLELQLTSFDCAALGPLAPTLQELTIIVADLDVSSCPPLPALTLLKDIKGGNTLQLIRKACAPLRYLGLCDTDLTGFRLSDVPTLTSVELHGCTGLTDETFDMPVPSVSVQQCDFVLNPTNVHLFQSCTHLDVRDSTLPNSLTDGDMHHLANLEEVDVTVLQGVGEVGMRKLAVRQVAMSTNSLFNYAGLLALPCLESITYTSWGLKTDSGTRALQQLAYLALMKPSLKRIELRSNDVEYEASVLQDVFATILPPIQTSIRVRCIMDMVPKERGCLHSATFTFSRHGAS